MPDHPTGEDNIERGALSESEVRELAARLYTSEHDRLVAIAAHHGPALADPEDTVQGAFAAFVARFDLTEELAVPWLVTTTKRLAWRARRTVARRHELADPRGAYPNEDEQLVYRLAGEGPEPLERVIDRETAAARIERIAELSASDRQVAALRALGYGSAEIELITGLTKRQIRRAVDRVHRKLGVRTR